MPDSASACTVVSPPRLALWIDVLYKSVELETSTVACSKLSTTEPVVEHTTYKRNL